MADKDGANSAENAGEEALDSLEAITMAMIEQLGASGEHRLAALARSARRARPRVAPRTGPCTRGPRPRPSGAALLCRLTLYSRAPSPFARTAPASQLIRTADPSCVHPASSN
jgi:hypothetical protein